MLAVSDRVSADVGLALSQSDPLALARDAQLMQVHTLIGPVVSHHADVAAHLPADLVLFFQAMHAANRQRLAAGMAQLEAIGAALRARDIPAVVLKGGGDMLSSIHEDPAARYVGDLDILVPANRAAEAFVALCDLGAAPAAPPAHETSRFDWRGQRLPEHHLPRLVRSDWAFPVEIHIHLGPGNIAAVLEPAAVIAHRVPTLVAGLSVASDEDRACNLLTHSIRHGGMISLRAWVDWSRLRLRCDRAAVASRLRRAGYGKAFESCEVMADLLGATGAATMSETEKAIARAALRSFCAAGNWSVADLARFVFRRVRGLTLSSAYRRHVAGKIAGSSVSRNVGKMVGGAGRALARNLKRRPKK